MALKSCKECNHQISTSAKTCPNCGYKTAPLIGGGWITIIVFILIFAFIGAGKSPEEAVESAAEATNDEVLTKRSSEPSQSDLDYQAKGACILAIKANLHDPSSAEIYSNDAYIENQNGIYTVQMKVRATNGFGAKRLSVFECKLMQNNDTWLTMGIKEL